MQSKIQDLSDQVTDLQQRNAALHKQVQELLLNSSSLESALGTQADQLQRMCQEYALIKGRSMSHIYVPSSTLQFDPAEDLFLKYPATAASSPAEHINLATSGDVKGYVPAALCVPAHTPAQAQHHAQQLHAPRSVPTC